MVPEQPGMRPIATVLGLLERGKRSTTTVTLYEGQQWWVGRADRATLDTNEALAEQHLGLPDACPDVPVMRLHLEVGRTCVTLSPLRDAVWVDGAMRTGEVRLPDGVYRVKPSPQVGSTEFTIGVHAEDTIPEPPTPTRSGTTLALRIKLDRNSVLWPLAHALAWPVMPTRARPDSTGWDGPAVTKRYRELGWSPPDSTRPDGGLKRVSQELKRLAEKVEKETILTNGEPASKGLQSKWPPWHGFPERPQQPFAAHRNMCVAVALWRAGAVSESVIDQDLGRRDLLRLRGAGRTRPGLPGIQPGPAR